MQLISFGNPRETLPPAGSYQSGAHFPRDPNGQGCGYRVSNAFAVVDGRRMPLILELEALGPGVDGGPMWFARVELHGGSPKIVNFGFFSHPGQRELKWSDFQSTRAAVYVYYAAFCADLGPDGEPVRRTEQDEEKRIAEFIEQRRTGRRRLKTDDYKYAAQVYKDNFDDTPTQAVADAFEVGIRRAGDIVAECRKRGFLSRTTKQGKKKI